MSIMSRIQKLEDQAKPEVETLAKVIGATRGLAIVNGISKPGLWILPDGRAVSPAEFDELAEKYRNVPGPAVVILDR